MSAALSTHSANRLGLAAFPGPSVLWAIRSQGRKPLIEARLAMWYEGPAGRLPSSINLESRHSTALNHYRFIHMILTAIESERGNRDDPIAGHASLTRADQHAYLA